MKFWVDAGSDEQSKLPNQNKGFNNKGKEPKLPSEAVKVVESEAVKEVKSEPNKVIKGKTKVEKTVVEPNQVKPKVETESKKDVSETVKPWKKKSKLEKSESNQETEIKMDPKPVEKSSNSKPAAKPTEKPTPKTTEKPSLDEKTPKQAKPAHKEIQQNMTFNPPPLKSKDSETQSNHHSITESSQMKVLVRVRPLNSIELEMRVNHSPTLQVNNDAKSIQVYNPDGKITVMGFNHVYDDIASQHVMFEESGVKDLVLQAMCGYATTIFAFGQTGSGKTFTITGPLEVSPDPDTVGIVPRALSFLFNQVEKQKAEGVFTDLRIQASYLEIYNENVLDLLNPQNSGLPVRWSQERGFFVENLLIVDCDSLDDCLAVLEEGLRNRTTGAHASNEHSSRSHSVLTIYLEIQGFESEDMKHRYGKITFVDLAGSEKVKETKSDLYTFNEALSINKSLLTLGKCITTLADPRTRTGHIPFRDSKLTKLLADSLGGKGSALMIACVSPSQPNHHETLKTLRYAMQARKIHNRPTIQLDPQEEMVIGFKTEIQLLKRENHRLRELLEKDGRFQEQLKELSEEIGLHSKKLKSRPASPVIDRIRARNATALPEIKRKKSDAASKPPQKWSNNQVVPLPNVKGRPSITSLPNRLLDPKRKSAKSASRQRIDEMRKSNAPAGHDRSKSEKVDKSKSRSTTPFPSHKKQKSIMYLYLTRKRPSATESTPHIIKEPFPEPRSVKSPDVQEVVKNRHKTMNEVQALEKEIERLDKKGKR